MLKSSERIEPALEIKITSMLAEHVPSVIELERQCQLSTRDLEAYINLLKEPTSILMVALNEDRLIVGCFSGWLVADELEIDNVAVAPDWRRASVGTRLLVAALETARKNGAEKAFLEVRSNNSAACLLYEKIGFEVVGRRKNYYRDPVDDALILSRKIASLN